MWKFIFRHKKYRVALEIRGEDLEDGHAKFKEKMQQLMNDGITLPPITEFELAEQIHD